MFIRSFSWNIAVLLYVFPTLKKFYVLNFSFQISWPVQGVSSGILVWQETLRLQAPHLTAKENKVHFVFVRVPGVQNLHYDQNQTEDFKISLDSKNENEMSCFFFMTLCASGSALLCANYGQFWTGKRSMLMW